MNQQMIMTIGTAVLFIGIIIIVIGSLIPSSGTKTNTKVAVGGIIGFIPFGFGNDKTLMIVMFVIMALFMIIFYMTNFIR
jgi:uncharacterized membrane protein